MKRRMLLGAAAASAILPVPTLAQPAGTRVLRVVPQANLTVLDPIWTTAVITRHHGYMVYDQICALDSGFNVRPQMAEGWEVGNDGRSWTFTLRDGLRFHDGEPVRAADCVASIRRWGARDQFGQAAMAVTDELVALDDRRFRFRLKQPFPLLATAIGKQTSSPCFVMPERVAATDPNRQITETVGSGPYRFLRDEFVPGARVAYQRFDGYRPRQEPPDWTSGGRVAHMERVEWSIIPDPATAGAAIQTGEVDFLEFPLHDLLPTFRRNRDLVVRIRDRMGTYAMLRFNHLVPPFDNPALRRALAMAVNQEDYMRAVAGNDPEMWRTCYSFWTCDTPLASDAGSAFLQTPDLGRAQAAMREAGYAGERVVMLAPGDLPTILALSQVTADLMRRLGFNLDLVVTDWGTLVQRRAKMDPVEQGGWNILHTTWSGAEHLNPAVHQQIRGNGRRGWVGWPEDGETERLRSAWFDAPDLASQQRIAAAMQERAYANLPYVPLGMYLHPNVWRSSVTDVIHAPVLLLYNIRKT
ncbi:ABC transporter substrate-binding protein [Elioraea sp.]|jgi:peptide/nickel transport system substrate-binding protein|uniref:ABC transporter substrate-binding protein n=1 Tax=Elioraea sp. TaxID=2185103 RepID=UPI003F70C0EB